MLYIMRHGRTDWNNLHKLQGRTDIPLNDEGRRQAEEAREKYLDKEGLSFDICYCSPLVRARETAEIFLKGRSVPIVTDDRLQEMFFGDCEGMTGYFDNPDFPLKDLFQHPEDYKASECGAESFDQVFARIGAFLDEIAIPQSESGKNVLIVCHGAIMSAIITRIINLPIKDFWSGGIKNCELKKLI